MIRHTMFPIVYMSVPKYVYKQNMNAFVSYILSLVVLLFSVDY